jgi:hypothetical protein
MLAKYREWRLRRRVTRQVRSGDLTINEARGKLGLTPLDCLPPS